MSLSASEADSAATARTSAIAKMEAPASHNQVTVCAN